jgi:hypothetical protein
VALKQVLINQKPFKADMPCSALRKMKDYKAAKYTQVPFVLIKSWFVHRIPLLACYVEALKLDSARMG